MCRLAAASTHSHREHSQPEVIACLCPLLCKAEVMCTQSETEKNLDYGLGATAQAHMQAALSGQYREKSGHGLPEGCSGFPAMPSQSVMPQECPTCLGSSTRHHKEKVSVPREQ
eukprot:scaffold132112_cov15-Tisochrysis_lutea.AAC.1